MLVRIYKPAKTAMQSGVGNTREWVIESEPSRKEIERRARTCAAILLDGCRG